jgi:hypothetical protein
MQITPDTTLNPADPGEDIQRRSRYQANYVLSKKNEIQNWHRTIIYP